MEVDRSQQVGCFTEDSALHRYLSRKAPNFITLDRQHYSFRIVMACLRIIITVAQLFDAENPNVILCDGELEEALNLKALHVSQVRPAVCKQFRLTTAFTTPASAPDPVLVNLQSDLPLLPSWASPFANAVLARQHVTLPFNIEGRYTVKPAFLRVLRTLDGVNRRQTVFPYREVANLLCRYIMKHKDKFFDLRNILVAMVEGDLLGAAFGVRAFARCQVTFLMRAQLVPFEVASASSNDENDMQHASDSDVETEDSTVDETGDSSNAGDQSDDNVYTQEYEIDSDTDSSIDEPRCKMRREE